MYGGRGDQKDKKDYLICWQVAKGETVWKGGEGS